MAKSESKVWKAVAVKVISPPPNNVVVCLPVVKDGKLLGQLQSENMPEEEAEEMVRVLNEEMLG